MFETRQQLTQEFIRRAKDMGLSVDVPSDGAFGSEVAIIAEAPGEREKATRVPLVGGSGQHLWNVLRKYGISRSQVYVTNVIKRQVSLSTHTDERVPVAPNELAMWEGLLQWELAQLPNLRYVVLLGNFALSAVTGESGIMSWRGSVMQVKLGPIGQRKEVTAICAINPAMVLREPKHDITFRMDIDKLQRVRDGKYPEHKIEHLINPSFREAMDWLDKMQDDKLPVSYDIESIANETACVGFANGAHKGMCIAFRGLKDSVYSTDEELQLRRRMQKLFGDPSVRLVAQNGNFDAYWMWFKDRIKIHKNWYDTLLAHHTLYSTLPHNLGYLTSQYTTHPYYKEDKQGWREGGDIDRFWRYNVKDACITLKVQQETLNELRSAKLDEFFFTHVMRLQPHLTRMTVKGMVIDQELKNHIATTLQVDVDALREQWYKDVHEATGDTSYFPSPSSPKQKADLFFNKLRLVGRGTSTNKENVKRMMEHPRTLPAVRKMLTTLQTFMKEQKFSSTYAEMEIDDDGRARCEYKQFGTVTAPGRLSSGQVAWGTGANFQNQTDRSQPMFVAPPGYCFVYFDLAQAEARYVGWDAKIYKWMEQFEKARLDGVFDCHRALASDMWHIPYDDVPHEDIIDGEKTKRYIAKRCRHGLNYRMNWPKLAETAGLTMKDAEWAYNVYHRTTPELRTWWNALEKEVISTKMLFNAYGRRLIILERITDEALESIVAFKPQSTIGDKVSRCIYLCEDDGEWPMHARVCLNIHDALIAVCRIEDAHTCARIMKKHAEEPLYIHGEELIIPADLKMSTPTAWEIDEETHKIAYFGREDGQHRWAGMKKVKLDG